MQPSLSRYLIIFTLAQLPMLVLAAFFPYLFNGGTLSPSLRILLRTLLDYLPCLILAAFLWYDMARTGKVSPTALLLTLTCGLAGLLMHRSRLPLVRHYAPAVIAYPILLFLTIYFLPAYTTLLGIAFQILILILVLNDLFDLYLPRTSTTRWFIALLIITCFTTPHVAILVLLLLCLPSSSISTESTIKSILTYLIPIAIFSLARRLCAAIPAHITLFGIPASVTVTTVISLILFILIIVLLYRDAPKARLPRFWLCASAIGSASVSAMCYLFARHEHDNEDLPTTENIISNTIQQQL